MKVPPAQKPKDKLDGIDPTMLAMAAAVMKQQDLEKAVNAPAKAVK